MIQLEIRIQEVPFNEGVVLPFSRAQVIVHTQYSVFSRFAPKNRSAIFVKN
jgi:hypothetical protein